MSDKKGVMVKCLGWCGKEFLSTNKAKIRFCKKCTAKKDAAQRGTSLKVFASVVT